MNKVSSLVIIVMSIVFIGRAVALDVEEVSKKGTQVVSPPIITEDARRAQALLDKAISHVQNRGAGAISDFSNQSRFTDKELYVFTLDIDGVFLSSGGSSAVLVGDNVTNTADMHGKLFFRDMIEIAKQEGGGTVEYYWTNPVDSRGEPKRTMFKRIGDAIVAVGYYPSRSTDYQARGFLDEATKALINDEQDALAEFNHHDSQFVKNDLYVFVLDKRTGVFLAHGATPNLVGKVFNIKGKPMIEEMLKLAEETGRGEINYPWLNPTSGKVESKHTYYRILDNKLVAVGYYPR
ncbi:cache domain-containing protein [Photobacterium minamisatsumaniensis]|uniref:cache domain-containing protein n=1 Tax=Photobacterium minamisatsumaniensis TaxID=2910233 RepID=UPI003D0A4183